jgi:hypothetical protein
LELATQSGVTTDAKAPAYGIANQIRGSQSATESKSGPGELLPEEPTYRVFFVLRVVGRESSGPDNAAASIMAKDAEPQAGLELLDANPSDPPNAEQSPAPPTQQQ